MDPKEAAAMKRYVPSKSLIPSAQHQHLMSLYNLPAHDEPRPMCGQAMITKLLKKSDNLSKNTTVTEQGLFSMELAADTESDGGSASIPKFIMKMNSEELKRIQQEKHNHNSNKKKMKSLEEYSPSSKTSLTTEDLAQLSPYSPPNSPDDDKSKNKSPLRVCVAETGIGPTRSLMDNLSSHGSADTYDSLVSNMKSVLEEQQKALVEMAEQNRQFKEALMQYNAEIYQLREERAEQKIRMAQLVLQNETFETQSVVLRSEISTLKSMIDEKQDEELRKRFESLLDEDTVYDGELEDKILGEASFDSVEDDLLTTTTGATVEPAFIAKGPNKTMTNATVDLQKAMAYFGKTTANEEFPSMNQADEESPSKRPQSSNPTSSHEDVFEKARRALSRKVAEESPRAALAPRSTGDNNKIQRQASGVIESIEVALDDDHETVFTAMSTISGVSKSRNSVNEYKDRLGQIKKKRKERISLPSLFEAEIGKRYEA